MESETLITRNQPIMSSRVLSAVVPVLWIAVSYVDPGKWATTVEGGAQLGFDIALLMLILNCAAILCQYLSARIAIATGKNLAQICREEYDTTTCALLGIQVETSIIVLDLTMVLGSAYGLNAVFGIDLYTCVFLTGIDAVLFPFLANVLVNPKAKFSSICLASFVLVSYVCLLLISQPESAVSLGGVLNKLSSENAFALMSLLGANIMPHNFYLHSSLVQQEQGQTSVSKVALCQDHFFATLCIFSGIFLVNCMLMNSSASMFYGTGLVSLTFQDALALLDQASKSSIASVALILIMFLSNQLISLPWTLGREAMTRDFFRIEIPCWFHRAAIRVVAIITALYCVGHSGDDGMIFQLLIFTQVVIALLLPSSVIPLFLFASSESVMGAQKVSNLIKFLALVSFVGMLGLNIVFVMELVFGSSDWASNIKWSIGSGSSLLFFILLIAAFASLCFMLWLAITPLKSASPGIDVQAFQWEEESDNVNSSLVMDKTEIDEVKYQLEKSTEWQEPLSMEKSFEDHHNLSILGADLNLPETFLDPDRSLHLSTIQESVPDFTFPTSNVVTSDASSPTIPQVMSPESCKVITDEPIEASILSKEPKDEMVEKPLKIEGDVQSEKDDDENSWEPEDSTKDASESNLALASDGPSSFRSISGKFDDAGSGTGSLSRLTALGRAARRQLSSILDEFWGQLFDFHGLVIQDAKLKKWDKLLGVESKTDPKSSIPSVKLENLSKDTTGYFPSVGGRGTDSLRASNFYNSSIQKQMGLSNGVGPYLGSVQQGSPMWSKQQLDAYARNSGNNTLDASERRYYSVHVPPSSDAYEQQPATIHGYDLASYLSRMAPEKVQSDLYTKTATPVVKSNTLDPYSRSYVQNPQNGSRMLRPPGFHNVPVSRNTSMKSERPFQDIPSSEPLEYSSSPTPNVKKYYSMPDISGLYVPKRDYSTSGNITQWNNNTGYAQSINRATRDQMLSNASSYAASGLGYSDLSPSKVCKDAFSLQFNSNLGGASLWSKQPFERFGVADNKSSPKIQETASIMDMEAKLLQSFRSCINKLLRLDGSDWLFRQNDGADEDLIDRVAAREKFLYEVETRTSDLKNDEADLSKIISVPNCGDACVWKVDLIISFGVWCIHRILELSLMESRPELWGKYTFVLNRLQGIVDPAFSKPRTPASPCFCLQLPAGYKQMGSSPPISNEHLPPTSKVGRGKFTTASMLLDIIKDVELAISCRKGRSGTAAGEVAFPKGKENLSSVLKRYKRRLTSKPIVSQEASHGPRKTSQGL